MRQAATQGKGPGNEVGQANVPTNFKRFDPDKKSVSVRQPYGIGPNMMLLKDENLKELSHSDTFVRFFCCFRFWHATVATAGYLVVVSREKKLLVSGRARTDDLPRVKQT